jgi:hypothetical protein
MDVKVNAEEWKGLSNEDRSKIQAIIAAHFKDAAISGGDKILPAKQYLDQPRTLKFNFSNPLCTAACAVAEAAAVTACSALSGGILVAVCVAAAHEAGSYCRTKC